jgi:nucleoside-diphosphate-sugar epimerase
MFVITGATGWIGRAVLEHIFKKQGNLENVLCVASSGRVIDIGFTTIETITFDEAIDAKPTNATVFHLAYLTKDKNSLMTDAEYICTNHEIRDCVAQILNFGQKNFFYASSGAALHQNGNTLYGNLKLQDEKFFRNLCESLQIKCLNTRIFNIAGKHIQNYTHYAIADFILQLLETGKIKIASQKHVVRSYVNISNIVEIIFAFFEDLNSPKFFSFETCHETVNLLELARIVNETLANNEAKILHNINSNTTPNYYVGNGENQSILVAKYGIRLVNLRDSIIEMKDYLVNLSTKIV